MRTLAFQLFPSLLLILSAFVCLSVDRSNTSLLLGAYFTMFAAYMLLAQRSFNIKSLLVLALAMRLMAFGFLPNLSDDLYRFVWDGWCSLRGISPYQFTPSELLLRDTSFSQELFAQLNSPEYISVYPPLAQVSFAMTTFLSGGDLMISSGIFRIQMLLAESLLVFFLYHLLPEGKFKQVLPWLLLNPLWLLESYGNLHFELVMLSFLLGSVVLLVRQKWLLSAVFLALAASFKLHALILLPYFFFRLGWKKGALFSAASLGFIGLLYIPLLPNIEIEAFISSFGLYFKKFEFNASLYYMLRWIRFEWLGYNDIARVGPFLAALSTAFILFISYRLRKKDFSTAYVWIMLIFLIGATTVHPWYILGMILFGSIADLRFPLLWSSLIFLSYFAYGNENFQESLLLIGLEYTIVLLFILYELDYLKIFRSFKAR